MKPIFFLLIFSCNLLGAQPILRKMNTLQELPKLTIKQLVDTKELLTFSHRDGLIIYNPTVDEWKLYTFIEHYEDKGRIIKIQKFDSLLVISLVYGGIIISNGQIIPVESTFLSSFLLGNKLIAMSSKLAKTTNNDVWDQQYQYNTVSQILFFNTNTTEIDTIKLSKKFHRIKSCVFYNNRFWVSVVDDSGEDYWSNSFLEIDLSGNVIEHTLFEENEPIHKVLVFDGHLYIVNNSGLFRLNNDMSIRKLVTIEHVSDYDVVNKNNLLYFILNNHPDDGSREIVYLTINLKNLSRQEFFFISDATSLNYSEYIIQGHNLLCKNDFMSRIDKIDFETPHSCTKYSTRDGITSYIRNVVEDQNEIWFISSENGLSRFSKGNNTWKNYSLNTDLRVDSTNFLAYDELSLNEDYIFIPLRDNTTIYRKYLIFNRSSEDFEVLTIEEFKRRFFYHEGKFSDYKGQIFISPQYADTLEKIIPYVSEWTALLFLYDLPVSGCRSWGSRNNIISNSYCTILSISVLDPPTYWYKGLIVKFKDVNSLKVSVYPQPIRNFEATGMPYMIAGDDEMIYAAGNSGIGLLTFRIMEEVLESNKKWFDTFHGIKILNNTENYILIGNHRGGLYSFEKTTHSIHQINDIIGGSYLTVESTDNYIYIGTGKGLLCFDNTLNYIEKLTVQQGTLHKTDYGIYLNTGNSMYQIIEN